jgi:beta-glucosidase
MSFKTILPFYTTTFFLVFSFKAFSQVEKKDIEQLISQMTLEEKLGQLHMAHVDKVDEDLLVRIKEGRVGAILNGRTAFFTREERTRMQQAAVDSRSGIPLIFGHDVIHGFRTQFPIVLAQSCSWDLELVRQAARASAMEASNQGVDWAFSPMIDVSRDPRWGRIAESYGEDPYLNGLFGAQVVKGYQGDQLSPNSPMAACLKHFVGYGASESGLDYGFTEISENSLRQIYLPPFQMGIAAGAMTIMSAFNDISGVPASANPSTINDYLRQEIGFDGLILSDWESVFELISHGIARDTLTAAKKALSAGVDMEMKSDTYFSILKDSIQIDEKLIDQALIRMLNLKSTIGLFDQPIKPRVENVASDESNRALARESAKRSMVLLKNESKVLPLEPKKVREIALIGPYADEQKLFGWWSSMGDSKKVVTVQDALTKMYPDIKVTFNVTDRTDVIIACVGEPYNYFGENNNRAYLNLPFNQEDILDSLSKFDKTLVTVIFNGRPLDLSVPSEKSDALLIAWHPGYEAGTAVVDLLMGKQQPTGRLTTTFPRTIGQIPIYYAKRRGGRPQHMAYKDETLDPLYNFGYGLGYNQASISNAMLANHRLNIGGNLEILVDLENRGINKNYPCEEVVQIYLHQKEGNTTVPYRRLVHFERVNFDSDHLSTKILIHSDQLKYWNGKDYAVDLGEYELHVSTGDGHFKRIPFIVE